MAQTRTQGRRGTAPQQIQPCPEPHVEYTIQQLEDQETSEMDMSVAHHPSGETIHSMHNSKCVCQQLPRQEQRHAGPGAVHPAEASVSTWLAGIGNTMVNKNGVCSGPATPRIRGKKEINLVAAGALTKCSLAQ